MKRRRELPGGVRVVSATGAASDRDAPAEIVPRPPAAHAVRVRRERGGRRGKTVTVAAPLFLERAAAAELLGRLKRACGGGGTLKPVDSGDGCGALALELQGDHADRVVELLADGGFPVKRAGG